MLFRWFNYGVLLGVDHVPWRIHIRLIDSSVRLPQTVQTDEKLELFQKKTLELNLRIKSGLHLLSLWPHCHNDVKQVGHNIISISQWQRWTTSNQFNGHENVHCGSVVITGLIHNVETSSAVDYGMPNNTTQLAAQKCIASKLMLCSCSFVTHSQWTYSNIFIIMLFSYFLIWTIIGRIISHRHESILHTQLNAFVASQMFSYSTESLYKSASNSIRRLTRKVLLWLWAFRSAGFTFLCVGIKLELDQYSIVACRERRSIATQWIIDSNLVIVTD